MKYLKVFETEALQNEFRSSQDYIEPHVSCLIDGENVKYNKSLEQLKVPFTIEATQDGTTIYFRQSHYAALEGLDPLKVKVSTDNGETWIEVTAAVAEDDVPGAVLAELDEGDKVLIRGRNEAYGYYSTDNLNDSCENCNFWADSPCYVYGNIMSLIGGDDFARLRKVEEYSFPYFFSDYDTDLGWSWVLSKKGEELLLPAITLANYCYYNMFYACESLISAPELPATTLANLCYGNMFGSCRRLTTVHKLPATTLMSNCYSSMFANCTSLTTVPELPATTLAEDCYSNMFVFCTSLTTAPELPATTLANGCYNNMFRGCTSLTIAPELPATILSAGCYNGMFYGCTNLSYIKAMFTTTPGISYTSDWVKNVKATGTFVKNSAATWNVTGTGGVPTGWTVETASA